MMQMELVELKSNNSIEANKLMPKMEIIMPKHIKLDIHYLKHSLYLSFLLQFIHSHNF